MDNGEKGGKGVPRAYAGHLLREDISSYDPIEDQATAKQQGRASPPVECYNWTDLVNSLYSSDCVPASTTMEQKRGCASQQQPPAAQVRGKPK